jgi:large subunit ribosomal protein L18e
MARIVRKDNPELRRALVALERSAKAHDAPVWRSVADRLARPRHRGVPVNVGQLDRRARPDEFVAVPGKLLAAGELSKPLTVGAFAYSAQAREKIHRAGGKALTLDQLVRAKPDGTGVRLLG